MNQISEGIFEERKGKYTAILTKNRVPGAQVYQEDLVNYSGVEYRTWNIRRSKLAAAIIKGAKSINIRKDSIVLYLGAASGTTVSHISDITEKGFIFAVDFAPRVVRDLVLVAEQRKNIAPILADANQPEQYFSRVLQADVVYQDIAQKNQTEIFLKNCRMFLKKGGTAMLAVKARSIDVTQPPKKLFQEVRKELEQELKVIDYRTLDPFERDHAFFICVKN